MTFELKQFINISWAKNIKKRLDCYELLKPKLPWLSNIRPTQNLMRLSTYKFCICPEGNGVDTHRLWECLNLKVVPIVIASEFTDILIHQEIPLVVLDKWEDFDINTLNYSDYNFESAGLTKILNLDNYMSYLY